MTKRADRALLLRQLPCLFFFLALFVLMPAACCGASPEKQRLLQRLDTLIEHGGYILAGNDAIIAAANENTPFIPASTLKIVTSLGSLHILGQDFRFQTSFYTSAENDLYIKGYGDPFLTSEEILIILQTLAKQGLTTINNIFLDNGAFQLEHSTNGRGDSLNPYDAESSGLAANFNTINFSKHPDGSISSAEPQTPTLPIMLRLGKNLPAGTHRINLTNNQGDILTHTGELFRALQQRAAIPGEGIIAGKVVPEKARLLLSHASSQPLDQVIAGLLRYSNNFIANQLFLTCGAKESGYPATWEKSRNVFRKFLASQGLTEQQIVMVEGSGLSRSNLVTPAALLKILKAFHPYAHLLHTDQGRLIKSGTLTGVYCYAGYFSPAQNSNGFVVLLNQPKNRRDQAVDLLEKISLLP
ncbi:MAG: D-alanyl-D-alanine carboxypeptidase [Deltaproteobacteria bacterium]|nr:D-alanyl-D-alanine carboxypeptidase [Deltaproteobacteria bacterium]